MSVFRMLTLVFVILALASVCCFASVPTIISYQGKLIQPSGAPFSDGTYSITFRIYEWPNGGTALWTETNGNVQLKSGLFSVLLGSVNPIQPTVFSGPDRWLEIKVGEAAEFVPRQKIASVAYAQTAATAAVAENVLQQRLVLPVNAEYSGALSSSWTKVVDMKSPVVGLRSANVDDSYPLFPGVTKVRVYLGLYATFNANPSRIQARVRWFNSETATWGYSAVKTGRPLYSFGRNPHIIGYWEDTGDAFGGTGIGWGWWQFEVCASTGAISLYSPAFLVLEPVL